MKMDAERIAKWKCLICGSKKKKVSTASKNGNKVGFSMICCECGHVDSFATDAGAIPAFTIGLSSGKISDVEISCGCTEYDRKTCENHDCACKRDNNVNKNNNGQTTIIAKPKAISSGLAVIKDTDPSFNEHPKSYNRPSGASAGASPYPYNSKVERPINTMRNIRPPYMLSDDQ